MKKSDPRAVFRCVPFIAVALSDMKTPLTAASLGTFVVKISKNFADAANPAATSVVEVDATDQPGVFYVQLGATDIDFVGKLIVYVTTTGGTAMAVRPLEVDIEQAHIFTVSSATTTAIVCDHAVSTADFWKNALVVPLTGSAVGQVAKVSTSASGLLGLDAEATFALAPANGDVIELVVR